LGDIKEYNKPSGGIMKRSKSLAELLKEGVLGAWEESNTFSALEIFETAELIERQEMNFYKKARLICEEPQLKELYSQLSSWREMQAKKIAHIREMFSERTGEFFNIEKKEQPNVASMMASLAMFTNRPFVVKGESINQKKEKILLDAIRRAEEAIVYYSGLEEFAGDTQVKKILDKIIGREKHHIKILNEQLANLKDFINLKHMLKGNMK
jgi:rubrerythrin